MPRLLRFPALTLVFTLLLPAAALAERIPGPADCAASELPLILEPEHATLRTLRDDLPPAAPAPSPSPAAQTPSAAEAAPASAAEPSPSAAAQASPSPAGDGDLPPRPPGWTLAGDGPWPLLDGVVPETSCRAPRLSRDGGTALAVCRGLDTKSPRSEHVVVRRGARIVRYALPVALLDPPAEAALSSDGRRFAVVTAEGGGRVLHVVDVDGKVDTRVGGGFREPGNPALAGDAASLAFPAQVGRARASVQVLLDAGKALRACVDGSVSAVHAVSADGARVLLSARPADAARLYLVDGERGLRFDLSGDKGETLSAAMNPLAEQAVFASRVGGVCALFWVDLVTRTRADFLAAPEGCFGRVGLDDERRLVLFEERRGSNPLRNALWDRKARDERPGAPASCSDLVISGDGLWLAGTCQPETGRPGVLLLPVPQEESREQREQRRGGGAPERRRESGK